MENCIRVLVPTHSRSGTEGLGNSGHRRQRAQRQFKRAGYVCRAILHRESERLLGGEAEFPCFLVEGDVAAGGLRCEPLAKISLVGFRFYGELGGGHRSRSKRFVETELFTDHDHARVHCRSEIAYELADKRVQLIHIQSRLR
jgi:hypothetical protein